MDHYMFTILAGILLVGLTGWLMTVEEKRRKRHYQRRYDTDFLDLDTEKARRLYRSHYIIGRRKRRCDIRIKDSSISRVHAILWHDGSSFCIAPCRDMELLEKKEDRSILPEVYVNGNIVPPEGIALDWDDVIRLGNRRFQIKDGRNGGTR